MKAKSMEMETLSFRVSVERLSICMLDLEDIIGAIPLYEKLRSSFRQPMFTKSWLIIKVTDQKKCGHQR